MKKDIHIAFGFTGRAILTESNYIDIEKDEILCFTDPLNIGPLCDLNRPLHVSQRKEWLDNTIGSSNIDDNVHFVDDNVNSLKKLIESIDSYNRICLWLGNIDNEQLTASWLLYHLQLSDIPVFKVNFDRIVYKNRIGNMVKASSLRLIDQTVISKIDWPIELMSEEAKRDMVSLWERIRDDEYVIHTLDKDGKLISSDESYFDSYLLDECSSEPVRSALIVAHTLCKIWDDHGENCSIGDGFLFHRLNQLGEEGLIEITERSDEPDRASTIFTVRKVY
ncbi:DUF1835 domain-containing protein [Sphingobacterium tabacisoli]|uniref:DUF1835 domain-containing protein n=1 Tax=Sphingobacterium tabacisoli TaxID=2044855 RepID=A0ABW5L6X8_9SPHI|nr:DUF1835 domain-containing protein [Sphingobacterium tabacisoli]